MSALKLPDAKRTTGRERQSLCLNPFSRTQIYYSFTKPQLPLSTEKADSFSAASKGVLTDFSATEALSRDQLHDLGRGPGLEGQPGNWGEQFICKLWLCGPCAGEGNIFLSSLLSSRLSADRRLTFIHHRVHSAWSWEDVGN